MKDPPSGTALLPMVLPHTVQKGGRANECKSGNFPGHEAPDPKRSPFERSHPAAEREDSDLSGGFFSEKAGSKTSDSTDTKIWFEENLTLCAARSSVMRGAKTAVLNFANPVEPGGGVLRGANAQEEYLCRASNLYYSLQHSNADKFYSAHKRILNRNQDRNIFLATDAAVFSPGVTVFKRDAGYVPSVSEDFTPEYTDDWFQIDVITCAAPMFLYGEPAISNGDLQHLFERRIGNIFEVAIENEVEALILGAFGCGAFCNPPHVVAAAFKTCLASERYRSTFQNVVFAIKGSRERSPNRRVFEAAFS